jgi:peptidyl-prolyl cis-trans isomerase C
LRPLTRNLARASLLAGNIDQAIQSAHKAIELDPKFVDGYVTLGSAYVEQNDLDRSIQYLEQASKIAPDHALVRQNLQYVREQKEEFSSAKETGRMRAAHIVVDNRGLADALFQKILAGEDFALLARTHSVDPSGQMGGDIGAFMPGDLMAEFERLVKSLKSGEVGGPLKTGRGFHIVKRIY